MKIEVLESATVEFEDFEESWFGLEVFEPAEGESAKTGGFGGGEVGVNESDGLGEGLLGEEAIVETESFEGRMREETMEMREGGSVDVYGEVYFEEVV